MIFILILLGSLYPHSARHRPPPQHARKTGTPGPTLMWHHRGKALVVLALRCLPSFTWPCLSRARCNLRLVLVDSLGRDSKNDTGLVGGVRVVRDKMVNFLATSKPSRSSTG